jgi:hypothetical protein
MKRHEVEKFFLPDIDIEDDQDDYLVYVKLSNGATYTGHILGWDLARQNCITFTEEDDSMGFIPINVIQSINLVNIL